MATYQEIFSKEKGYLEQTLELLKKELKNNTQTLSNKKKALISSRKDMWNNTAHHSGDFTRLTEINHYLAELNQQTRLYTHIQDRIKAYKHMVDSPYFGRIDFKEDGYQDVDKIYIGISTLTDQKTGKIQVYDWRAPIASLFYRNDTGKAQFESPGGLIIGELYLKRQYKIRDAELKFFIDSNAVIKDEMLQEILSHNSSPEMRNIVETIQYEQDLIIRDTENELLMVQGIAGSGKTAIALHRIAFLLYEGLTEKLDSNNVIIISPNDIFSN